MATAGERSRGPDTSESYRDVSKALRDALTESPIDATALKKVVEKSSYSRATVNDRLKEMAAAGDCQSGEYNGTTWYWVDSGEYRSDAGGALLGHSAVTAASWITRQPYKKTRNDIEAHKRVMSWADWLQALIPFAKRTLLISAILVLFSQLVSIDLPIPYAFAASALYVVGYYLFFRTLYHRLPRYSIEIARADSPEELPSWSERGEEE